MGFWSKLGKGALYGGSIAAIPFTGGASGSLLGALGVGGNIVKGIGAALPLIGGAASAIGSGRAAGRQAEAQTQGQYDRTRLEAAQLLERALQDRANLDFRQKQFQLTAPGERAGNAVRGDILANVQDAAVTGPITGTKGNVPPITGGLRPSLMSANTRQLGQGMSRDALLAQMQGDKFQPMAPPNIPTPTPLPQTNAFDKILGGVGLAGGLLGTFGDADSFQQKYKPKVPLIPGNPNLPYIPLPHTQFEEDPMGGF